MKVCYTLLETHLDVEIPPFIDHFPGQTTGCPHLCLFSPYGDLESSTTLFLLPCFSEQCRDRNCPVFVCPSSTGNLNAAGQGTCFMLGNPDVCGHGGHANKHISPARHLLPKLGYDDMICISKNGTTILTNFERTSLQTTPREFGVPYLKTKPLSYN